MSIVNIRKALEVALAAITPAISIAYENAAFAPVVGTPYCKPYLLMATPDNPTMGDGFYRERGIFQITLCYPLQIGTAGAAAQAEVLQTAFKRGATFSNGGVSVKVMATPSIGQAQVDAERFSLPVKVTWQADIFG